MSNKSSLEIRHRNRQIRTRIALGESPQALAHDYGLKSVTIHAINKGYKGSGYEFNEDDYLSADLADLQKLLLSHGLDIHISTLIDHLVGAKKTRGIFASQFDEMYQIYSDSDPGSVTAQTAIFQISHLANKLLALEIKISSISTSIQAIRNSLSIVQRYKPCAKTLKK